MNAKWDIPVWLDWLVVTTVDAAERLRPNFPTAKILNSYVVRALRPSTKISGFVTDISTRLSELPFGWYCTTYDLTGTVSLLPVEFHANLTEENVTSNRNRFSGGCGRSATANNTIDDWLTDEYMHLCIDLQFSFLCLFGDLWQTCLSYLKVLFLTLCTMHLSTWSLMNRFQTGQSPCHASLHKWGLA